MVRPMHDGKSHNDYDSMWFHNEGVRVELVDIGEGRCEDYNPDDPNDYPHLRFYVQKLVGSDFEDVDDASYCTTLNGNKITPEQGIEICRRIWCEVVSRVNSGESVKKICEELSWITVAE